MIERHGGQIIVLKKWDERKLAYELGGQKRGLYMICLLPRRGNGDRRHRARCEAVGAGPPRAGDALPTISTSRKWPPSSRSPSPRRVKSARAGKPTTIRPRRPRRDDEGRVAPEARRHDRQGVERPEAVRHR